MAGLSEYIVIVAGVVLAGGYFFRESLSRESKPTQHESPVNTGGGDARDFVSKMKATVRTSLSLCLPYFLRIPYAPVAPRPLNRSRHDLSEWADSLARDTRSSDACIMQNLDFVTCPMETPRVGCNSIRQSLPEDSDYAV